MRFPGLRVNFWVSGVVRGNRKKRKSNRSAPRIGERSRVERERENLTGAQSTVRWRYQACPNSIFKRNRARSHAPGPRFVVRYSTRTTVRMACGHARVDVRQLSPPRCGAASDRVRGGERGLRLSGSSAGERGEHVRARATQYLTLHYEVPWIALSTLM